MSDMRRAERRPQLGGKRYANDGVTLAVASPMTRLAVRGEAHPANVALSFDFPTEPNRAASQDGRHALWLGPDEWLFLAAGENPDVPSGEGFTAVDVSHRNVAFHVEGARARETLEAGCPRDLRDASFPVGACARTLVGKAEVIVWREAEHKYHVEVWRSFAPYLWDFLKLAADDALL